MLAPLFLGSLLPLFAFGEEANSVKPAPAESRIGPWKGLLGRTDVEGLIEFGGAYKSAGLDGGGSENLADIHLTTVEIGIAIPVHDWIRAKTVFLYEDPFHAEEGSLRLDAAFVTLGNTEEFPLYLSAGKLYVPFGVIQTHLPDEPAVDQPMTLILGETSGKAAVLGIELPGFSLSGYILDGSARRTGRGAGMSHGFDGHFRSSSNGPMEMLLGASYLSNIANANCLADTVCPDINVRGGKVAGLAAYVHLGLRRAFFDCEYVTALEDFCPEALPRARGGGAQPSAWNIEAGYRWNRERGLETVFKYAGSRETEALGLARRRFGVGLNREIVRSTTASFAFLRDRYSAGDVHGRGNGWTMLGQIAVAF